MKLNSIVKMDLEKLDQWAEEIPHGIGKRIWSHYTFRVTGLENKGDTDITIKGRGWWDEQGHYLELSQEVFQEDRAFLMGTNNDLYFWAHQDWLIEIDNALTP